MAITLNGTTGITTPDITSSGALGVDASAPDNSLVVDSAGAVGIGTSSHYDSTTKLTVAGRIHTSNGTATGGFNYGGGAVINMGSMSNHPVQFIVNNSTKAVIDTSGNLLVGTTTNEWSGSMRMAVSGSKGLSVSSTGGATSEVMGLWNKADSGTRYQIYFADSAVGGIRGSISTNGSSTTYSTSSDYRLKEDWQPMTGASERVKALKPVNFAWKVDGSRVDGFLAHEAQEVVPECVTGVKDATEMVDIKDEDGNVTGQEERPVYQGIDQSKLVPLLTAALQEALTKIDSLTARIEALEAA